ncbi:MAG TPA: TrmH family RNA methyltransferase [Thermomicrobiales bacterium]|nr:TrmH family RNA methyltransferase [Thermomicrobiales bacterium]
MGWVPNVRQVVAGAGQVRPASVPPGGAARRHPPGPGSPATALPRPVVRRPARRDRTGEGRYGRVRVGERGAPRAEPAGRRRVRPAGRDRRLGRPPGRAGAGGRRAAPARGRRHHRPLCGGQQPLAGPRRFLPLGALLTGPRPFIALLDGLEDPYTFGHAVRALYAAGVDGLVVRPRDWLPLDGTIARASAGTTELLPAAIADPAGAVAFFKTRGLSVACATQGPGAVPMYNADLAGPLCLVLGGEKRGVSRALLGQADVLVQIPYGRAFARSPGLTAAAAALAFEVSRQRRRDAR